MARKRKLCEVDADFWCELCPGPIDFDEPGSTKRHCSGCAPAHRQARSKGLTVEQVNAILRVQEDMCPICGEGPGDDGAEGVSWWQIDHDHKCKCCTTGCRRCVRGLLCKPCNLHRVAWYERLGEDRQTWPLLNAYLSDPPARQPAARQIEPGDVGYVRAREGGFAGSTYAFRTKLMDLL
ncbi:endonuclease domain-containing protein [Streptomyces sp. CB02923]|uniref:endonuclease domain-containing protein n=1 Tax=Streptomyces sp. CB02923 TaxID=1718985 RepID=UPI001900FFB4